MNTPKTCEHFHRQCQAPEPTDCQGCSDFVADTSEGGGSGKLSLQYGLVGDTKTAIDNWLESHEALELTSKNWTLTIAGGGGGSGKLDRTAREICDCLNLLTEQINIPF